MVTGTAQSTFGRKLGQKERRQIKKEMGGADNIRIKKRNMSAGDD